MTLVVALAAGAAIAIRAAKPGQPGGPDGPPEADEQQRIDPGGAESRQSSAALEVPEGSAFRVDLPEGTAEQCIAGDPEACQLLATAVVTTSFADEAAATLRAACDAGVHIACGLLGAALRELGDVDGARSLLQIACDAGDAVSCDLLVKVDGRYDPDAVVAAEAAAQQQAMNVAQTEAFNQLVARCEQSDPDGCLGVVTAVVPPGMDVAAQRSAALARLERGCEASSAGSCFALATYLAELAEPRDPERALATFDRACELGMELACDAARKARGELPPEPTAEERRAAIIATADAAQLELLREAQAACSAGDRAACRSEANIRFTRGDVAAARTRLEEGCEADDARSCFDLAVLLRESPDPTAAASLDEVRALAAIGCDDGIVEACDLIDKLQ